MARAYNTGMRNGQKWMNVLLLLFAALTGCGRGENATPATVAAAESKWKAAGVKNYNLEWSNSGLGTGHYRVFVRDGEVKAIYSVLNNGREIVAKPAQPRFYSVEGLFLTIKDEMAQLDLPTPFGQPKGTTAILKFTPDSSLGYPKSYRRDVLGSAKGVSIDVQSLDPNPQINIPPPVSGDAAPAR